MRRRPVAAIYAIQGPNGVYIGQSTDCWGRSTFQFALSLGLDCGIVREVRGKSLEGRLRVEAEVARLFTRRGFNVMSSHRGRGVVGRYLAEHELPITASQPAEVHAG